MKRKGNFYKEVCSIENLIQADKKARKDKGKQKGIQQHDKARGCNIIALHNMLATKQFKTSKYKNFKVFDRKERNVFKLPYYPDRIVHHAIMQPVEPIITSVFISDTYSSIKGKGVHGGVERLKNILKDVPRSQYCLKLDVRKFYESIDHGILMGLLYRKIKDYELLRLLEGIIDSAPGLPIGNYLSQSLANFFLAYFDHWIKETMGVKYYIRYCDDIVVLHHDKQYLHGLLAEMRQYLEGKLKLTIKGNYQVFPVANRGIDVLGYVFFHTHVLLRKSTKLRYTQMMKRNRNPKSIAAYNGWLKHCNSKNLQRKYGTI